MNSRRRVRLWTVLFLFLVASVWVASKLLDTIYFPMSAIDKTRDVAVSNGHTMRGYFAEYVEHRSTLGYTKVRVSFMDCATEPPDKEVVVVLYRDSFLSTWNVESTKAFEISGRCMAG